MFLIGMLFDKDICLNADMAESTYTPPNNSSFTQQLNQISREVVDLLKHAPNCQIPFSKFIPEYHHHFGRQCRVADYGYTKLIELLEAIPHVVQVSILKDLFT